MTRHLVLFDIDGTLLDVRGAGRKSFSQALFAAWGINDGLEDFSFAGATDLGVLETLRVHHPAIEMSESSLFFHALEQELSRALEVTTPLVYPGALETVTRLSTMPSVKMGLVTGNASACAKLKVTRAGFDIEDFPVGAYGDEHPDRNVLARSAFERAVSTLGDFQKVTLVGDTPSDIRAAHSIGACAVGVCTGSFDAQALRDAGADLVLPQLRAASLLFTDSFDKTKLA